jgi:hypothetical protein
MWAVEGETVETGREEHKRSISGTVILNQKGGLYSSTFTMSTMFPTPDGAALETDVIGEGEGTVEGSKITGEARTQLVVAGVFCGLIRVCRTTSTHRLDCEGGLQPDGPSRSHPEQGRAGRTKVTRCASRKRVESATAPQRAPSRAGRHDWAGSR